MKQIRLAVFDLDGTLVDSAPDLARAVDAMLADYDLPAAGIDKVRTWIGDGTPKLVERALTAANPAAGKIDAQAAHAGLLRYYAAAPCRDTRVYAGARDCLEALQQRGLVMALVTNKPAALLAPILEGLRLARFFALTIGGDTLAHKKPHPEPLRYAAGQTDTANANCLIVGDSTQDIVAARQAGFRSVAVTYGYNAGQPIGDSGADYFVDTLAKLV